MRKRDTTSLLTYILHDTLCLLDLANKVILLRLNLGASLLAQGRLVVRVETAALNLALLRCLGAIEHESAVLNVATGLGGKLDVGVEGRLPASQEASLNLLVLGQPSLANFFFS